LSHDLGRLPEKHEVRFVVGIADTGPLVLCSHSLILHAQNYGEEKAKAIHHLAYGPCLSTSVVNGPVVTSTLNGQCRVGHAVSAPCCATRRKRGYRGMEVTNYGNWEEIKTKVEKNGDVVTVSMVNFVMGMASKLGVNVCAEISSRL